MLTISTGTMEVIDLADAALRSGGQLPVFVLRVNFVGVGRFAIAGGTDMIMGVQKTRMEIAVASARVGHSAVRLDRVIEKSQQISKKTDAAISEMENEILKLQQLF